MQSTDRQNDDHQPIDGAELNHHFAPDSNSPGGGKMAEIATPVDECILQSSKVHATRKQNVVAKKNGEM